MGKLGVLQLSPGELVAVGPTGPTGPTAATAATDASLASTPPGSLHDGTVILTQLHIHTHRAQEQVVKIKMWNSIQKYYKYKYRPLELRFMIERLSRVLRECVNTKIKHGSELRSLTYLHSRHTKPARGI